MTKMVLNEFSEAQAFFSTPVMPINLSKSLIGDRSSRIGILGVTSCFPDDR